MFRTVIFSKRCEMVRGCQKKMIYLKNTGSDVFDEAYFIVKDEVSASEILSDRDMIKEAERILSESVSTEGKITLLYRIKTYLKTKIIPILIGIIIGMMIAVIIK